MTTLLKPPALGADRTGADLLQFAVKMFNPRAVWCLCSGGNDSLTSTHLAMNAIKCDGVVSINTTIGIQQTRDHTQAAADLFGWPLRWLTPAFTYFDFCTKFGMPGPGRHDYVYAYLKERCVRQLVRESKRLPDDLVMLVSGVRSDESDARMGNVAPIYRTGCQLWVAPMHDWSEVRKLNYMLDNGIPRNPVRPVLGISGECLCGAFAKPGEREKIQQNYPDAYAEILRCEAAALNACKPAKWGERPVKKNKRNQLCQNCDRKNEVSP